MTDVPHWFFLIEPGYRVCRTCKQSKPVEEFRTSKKDRTQCMDCKRKDDARYRMRMRNRRTSWRPLIQQAIRD